MRARFDTIAAGEMPAVLQKSSAITQFRALSSAGKIDSDAGVIYGVSVITQGPALGHNVTVDETGVTQCLEACQSFGDEGVKLVVNHDSGFQEIVGSIKNFRIKGLQLLGDAHLLDSPADRSHILELAQKLPKNIGLSVETYGEPEKIDGKKFFRVTSIDAIALVPNPAANAKGLFSKKTTKLNLSEISTEDLRAQITQAATEDERFNQPEDEQLCSTCVWVSDILNNDGAWSAVIMAADGMYYEVAVTTEGTSISLGDEKEVIRTVNYKPVDTSQQTNPENMEAKELKLAIDEAIKPLSEELQSVKTKLAERDSEENKTKLAAKQKEDQDALDKAITDKVDATLKEKGDQIAADAVTKFAASIGVKKAPDSKTVDGKEDNTFEGRIATHLAAMPNKDRGKAILRARSDDPKGYNTWVAAGNN